MTELLLFNADRLCPKCRGVATLHYESPRAGNGYNLLNGENVRSCVHPLYQVLAGEWIRRSCTVCRYEWPEACLDS